MNTAPAGDEWTDDQSSECDEHIRHALDRDQECVIDALAIDQLWSDEEAQA